jgi:hypothetical protein
MEREGCDLGEKGCFQEHTPDDTMYKLAFEENSKNLPEEAGCINIYL